MFWGLFVFVVVVFLFCSSSKFLTNQILMKAELLSFMQLRWLCHINNLSPKITTKIRFFFLNTWKSHSAFRIRYRVFPIYLISSCSRHDTQIREAEEKKPKDSQEITEKVEIFSNIGVEKSPDF